MTLLRQQVLLPVMTAVDAAQAQARAAVETEQAGVVVEAGQGVVHVRGFADLSADELVAFPNGLFGVTGDVAEGSAGVILLGPAEAVRAGDEVRRTGRVVDVPIGDRLLGRVVDALGRPLDNGGPITVRARAAVERPAAAILDRDPVTRPLLTGVKAVDAALPIGRGQRELIIGDRQTGKTALALAAILNQRPDDVICVYCAVGQRAASVAGVIEDLRAQGALERCLIVVAGGEEAPGLQFIAPYAATTMAEHFMQSGRDVLIVYDDLTRHARAYRELSLLLRRPPGREAYPGDIFYIHSRLLERSTQLTSARGGGSLTALPIVETQAQNISAYIPTNLISITDGQLYLSPVLFEKGRLPAVDVGKSVSRVGGKAQFPGLREVASDLRLSYSQFEELETFARFGARLDVDTRATLERGRRVREVLKQGERELVPAGEQVAVLMAAVEGLFDAVGLEHMHRAETLVRRAAREDATAVCQRIEDGARLAEDDKVTLRSAAAHALGRAGLIEDQGERDADA